MSFIICGVGIDIQSERGRGVTQQVLDTFNVRTAGNGHSRRRVPEVVRPCVRPAYTGGDSFEPLVKRVDCIVPSRLIREHQIVRVAPERASLQTVLQLLYPLGPEIFKGDGRGLDRAGFTALGGGGDVVFGPFGLFLTEAAG